LISQLRTHDVPCRTGGDEFTIILPDLSETDCALVVSRLRDKLRAANVMRELPVGMSIGSASWPGHADTPERMLVTADETMYADKRTQREARHAEKTTAAHVDAAAVGAGVGPGLRVLGG
jgi:two-component system cell cycle response regulator